MRNSLIILVSLLVGVPLFVSGQSDTLSQGKTNTLTLSSLVSSNASYYGQTAEERLPFAYVDLKFKSSWGWYIAGGGYHLLREDNFPSEMHLKSGFEFQLGPKADLEVGYNRSFYSKASPLLQASNPNSLSATLGIDHLFRSELVADYNFGQSEDIFISIDNSKNILLGQLGKKNTFYLKPGISIVAGTQRFYTTYIEDRKQWLNGLDWAFRQKWPAVPHLNCHPISL
ncbi:hypothetical protein HDC90_005185 [Pedobacter sp. AK013]|uniref:hypothetical protein n=1 Tax=Pedobacter sp. AK013 TaxID=2723071 RepID=UPI00160D9511|nr:hypothetical protein [Pedobacter sp. AK013]MBB6240507.1 hypothetical protein [Pedobacter sp. AK013]